MMDLRINPNAAADLDMKAPFTSVFTPVASLKVCEGDSIPNRYPLRSSSEHTHPSTCADLLHMNQRILVTDDQKPGFLQWRSKDL